MTRDTVPDKAAVVASLTATGQPFEIREQDVLGHRMRVFARRRRSLRELLVASAAHGDREYLVHGAQRITFAEHLDAVASLAQQLRERHGVGKGDRVAILAANSPEWITVFWAAAALGAVTVGMNAHWSAPEIAHGIADSEPAVLVADARRRPLLPEDLAVPVLSVEHDVPALAAGLSGVALPEAAVDEDDPAVILYTSGTSGRPKGATHSHRNVLCACDFHLLNDAVAAAMGAPPSGRRFLLISPLFHIATLHNQAVPRMAVGDTSVLYTGRFDVERLLRLVERERVTNWGAVPTMAGRIVAHGDLSGYDLSSLTTLSLSSAPSSPALMADVQRALPAAATRLGTSYGQTETSTAATVATAADLARWPDTVGTPAPTVDVEVRDESGRRVPDGVEGEVCVRGPQVMLGYWNNPTATEAAFDDDRWFHSGDLGTVRDGQLRISSRRSDLILRGGENVYPTEVENVLARYPGVVECIVLGVPHHDLGEEVAAVVVVSDDDGTTADDLAAHVTAQLARYKVPSRWTLTTLPLPRNATGKVVRSAVRVR